VRDLRFAQASALSFRRCRLMRHGVFLPASRRGEARCAIDAVSYRLILICSRRTTDRRAGERNLVYAAPMPAGILVR
jgi:hypothetical protein